MPWLDTLDPIRIRDFRTAAAATWLLALVFSMAPRDAVAQTQLGATELAGAKTLLELSRAELTAQEFALLSGKLAEAENAYVELTTLARASQAVAAVTEGGAAAATARATAVGGRALLGGVAELLPLLIFLWPSTAHAPGLKKETPDVSAARSRMEEKLKALAEAARQVDSEMQAAVSRAPKPTLERCMQACDGDQDARAAFGRTLPNGTPEQRRNRARYFDAISQSAQFCKNMCRAIFVH